MKISSVLIAGAALATNSLFADRIVLVAGGGAAEGDAPATECQLRQPFGAEFAPDSTMFIVEMTKGNRVLKVDKQGRLTVFAGNGQRSFSGDGGPASNASFNGMHNLAIAPSGDIYIADTWNYRVRKINGKTGVIDTFAGTGAKGFSGDGGPAREAQFGSVINVALDPSGTHLYVADIENRRIRGIDLRSGVVETVAGTGKKGVPQDGAIATEAPLVDPRAVAAAADGSFYILERSGHALRHVDKNRRIRTVAGTGVPGAGGDDGDARMAQLRGPKHLCFDLAGDVLIADSDNHAIRKLLVRDGKIVRVAGTGRKGAGGIGGSALDVELNEPHGVTVHSDGSIYIADSSNDRVLRIVR